VRGEGGGVSMGVNACVDLCVLVVVTMGLGLNG
jgi:hypothetical protein